MLQGSPQVILLIKFPCQVSSIFFTADYAENVTDTETISFPATSENANVLWQC